MAAVEVVLGMLDMEQRAGTLGTAAADKDLSSTVDKKAAGRHQMEALRGTGWPEDILSPFSSLILLVHTKLEGTTKSRSVFHKRDRQ